MRLISLLVTTLLFSAPAYAANETFIVKEINGRQARAEGSGKTVKEGDLLYFSRSPFKFKISAVKGNQITLILPEKNDLTVGSSLFSAPTEPIKKALDTESRLKQALEE